MKKLLDFFFFNAEIYALELQVKGMNEIFPKLKNR